MSSSFWSEPPNISRLLLVTVFSIVIIIVTACRPKSRLIWVTDECDAPCWASIQPGISEREDAWNLLVESSLIQNNTIAYGGRVRFVSSEETIEFQFSDGQGKGSIPINNNGLVHSINIFPDKYASLNDIVKDFGEPEYVYAYHVNPSLECFGADLLYSQLGTVVSIRECSTGSKIVLSNDGSKFKFTERASVGQISFVGTHSSRDTFIAFWLNGDSNEVDRVKQNVEPWQGWTYYLLDVRFK